MIQAQLNAQQMQINEGELKDVKQAMGSDNVRFVFGDMFAQDILERTSPSGPPKS